MPRSTGAGLVRPLQTGQTIECATQFLLYNFDIDGDSPKPTHRTFLSSHAHKILSNDSRTRMRVIGRASQSEQNVDNQQIAERRAREVVAFVRGLSFVSDEQMQATAIGASQPLSTNRESEEDRSVEVHFDIPNDFIIALENIQIVRQWREIETIFRREFQPLATQAGRRLQLGRRQPADVKVTFDRRGHGSRPCELLILGNEGGGTVFVGAHEDLRVCGIPTRDHRTGQISYVDQIVRVFDPEENEFAHFVANTALHEVGHVMGLPHVSDPSNYQFSTDDLGSNLPRERRTLETMRRHWGGRKRFNEQQMRRLVCAIRSGFYPGGMTIQAGHPQD